MTPNVTPEEVLRVRLNVRLCSINYILPEIPNNNFFHENRFIKRLFILLLILIFFSGKYFIPTTLNIHTSAYSK